jgi:hypothetical protein
VVYPAGMQTQEDGGNESRVSPSLQLFKPIALARRRARRHVMPGGPTPAWERTGPAQVKVMVMILSSGFQMDTQNGPVMFPLFCSISACPCLPAVDSVFPDTEINYNSTKKCALPPTLLPPVTGQFKPLRRPSGGVPWFSGSTAAGRGPTIGCLAADDAGACVDTAPRHPLHGTLHFVHLPEPPEKRPITAPFPSHSSPFHHAPGGVSWTSTSGD